MGKAKKKQLPKDFEALLENRSLEELKILFDTYDVNARGHVQTNRTGVPPVSAFTP